MKNILCISSCVSKSADPQVSMVKEKVGLLSKNQVRLIMVDPYSFPVDPASYYISPDNEFKLHLASADYSYENIGVVWYSKPYLKSKDFVQKSVLNKTKYSKQHCDFVYTAYEQFSNLYRSLFPDITWVSDYWNVMRANNRVYNLEKAKAVGFDIPETIITSNTADAYEFYCADKSNTIVKTLRISSVSLNNKRKLMYTTKLRDNLDKDYFKGLNYAPAIFQRHVDKVADIRSTVIGDEVLSAKIESDFLDWRVGNSGNRYKVTPHKLPKSVEEKAILLSKSMGLSYSAIDLALLKDGSYVYFENNPNGMWGFIERLSGLDISRKIAELLLSYIEKRG